MCGRGWGWEASLSDGQFPAQHSQSHPSFMKYECQLVGGGRGGRGCVGGGGGGRRV